MLPASLYLTATPRFQCVGLVPAVCLLTAASAVQRGKLWIGRLLVGAGATLMTDETMV